MPIDVLIQTWQIITPVSVYLTYTYYQMLRQENSFKKEAMNAYAKRTYERMQNQNTIELIDNKDLRRRVIDDFCFARNYCSSKKATVYSASIAEQLEAYVEELEYLQ